MYIERRISTGDGKQIRRVLKPKGISHESFPEMADYGLLPNYDPNTKNSCGCSTFSYSSKGSTGWFSGIQRIKVNVSLPPASSTTSSSRSFRSMGSGREPSFTTIGGKPGFLRRKRSLSPTPSMTSTSSFEEIRPRNKRPNVMKPSNKKFKEAFPSVRIPGEEKKPRFKEMRPRPMGDPVAITPKMKKVKEIVPKVVIPPSAPSKPKFKKVRFNLGSDYDELDNNNKPTRYGSGGGIEVM